jgi:hypothetical protein
LDEQASSLTVGVLPHRQMQQPLHAAAIFSHSQRGTP